MKRHMNHRRTEQNPAALAARREGSTLTEVLVALLIMSIGLVSVAVMFPLSVLRSIKGAQLTAATDARYNAEAMLAVFPNMIRNPTFIRQNAVAPQTAGLLFPDSHNGENFIIDPLGYAVISNPNNQVGNQYALYFGNGLGMTLGMQWTLRRYPVSWPVEGSPGADAIVTTADSWVLQLEGIGVPSASTSTNIQSGIGNTAVAVSVAGVTSITVANAALFILPTGVPTRAVIFSPDGLASQTRTLTAANGGVLSWAASDPLPSTFTAGGNVRIETEERRYTWLLTVRKDEAGQANVDVVVFFKRPIETVLIDETLYSARFTAGNTQVNVSYPVGGSKPFMHKGNFIFDANNCFWYRISNVFDPGAGTATITLDTPANYSSPIPQGPNSPLPCAMFPRNIVDVYPIGAK